MKIIEECKGCRHYDLSELELPCINCKHNHIGGEYEDFHTTEVIHKADEGKPRISLVPTGIIWAIARVREYGLKKYPETGREGWKTLSRERIRDAMLRHCLRYIEDPDGVDEESGLTHLAHLATNVAFLIDMEKGDG